ncbi:helicase/secretion neighborhood CpaE-like protein [Corynebacterium mustelae]|uniref:Helicase/secretion neighborhood CpaE-like protein n=1 Tax=Corynebacterium mustelae TaxID=571915 RepID=A0A0G3H1F2_9CORY|nr:septum site-determining protein Ssd [Corynebacterium mustelae]AKK07226.1 helicase/secretion neighborhood CpaE-like protein [Corynebacterium mustelae]
MTTPVILVAITDPVIHPEALSVAAATGMEIVDTTDPRDIIRYAPKASALLVDATTAAHAAMYRTSGKLFLLFAEPGPIDWKLAVHVGAINAFIIPAELKQLLSELGNQSAARQPTDRYPIIAVTASVGGVGASTLAASVALQSATEIPTVLIDTDPHSAGIDLLLGCELRAGIRWADLRLSDTTVDPVDIVTALPQTDNGLALLTTARGGLVSGITEEKIQLAIRILSSKYQVILDLPSHAPFFNTVADHCDYVEIISPAEVRATANAQRIVAKLRSNRIPCGLSIRHRGWSGLSTKDMEAIVGISPTVEIRTTAGLARLIETAGLSHIQQPKPLRLAATAIAEAAAKYYDDQPARQVA